MAVERLVIEIDLDDQKLKSSVSNALNALKRTAQDEGRGIQSIFQRSFSAIGRQIAFLGTQFAGIFTGVGITLAIRELARFEQAIIAVGKTTNLTERQLQRFSKQILDLSKRIPVSTSELLRISEVAGQLGINDAKQLEKFTETVARLGASVSGLSTEEAAIQLARITELTGGSIGDVDRLGSSLVALGNNFKVNEGQIARVSLEVAKIAGVYGVSTQDVLGFSTAIAQSGVEAQVARTTLLSLFDEFGKASTQGGKQLNNFARQTGLTIEEFKSLVENDPTELVVQLAESFKGLSGVQINERLISLGIEEKRVRTGFSALITTSDSLRRSLDLSNKAFEENEALLTESEKAFNSLGNQFVRFGNILKAISIELSGDLSKSLAGFLSQINNLLAADGAARAIEQLGIRIARIATIFLALSNTGVIVQAVRNIKLLGVAAINTGRSLVIAARSGNLYSIAVAKARVATKLFVRTIRAARAALTFGLAVAIDLVIEKFFEFENITPLENLNKQIKEQENILKSLNAQLQRGNKLVAFGRERSRFEILSEAEKNKIVSRINAATESLATLRAERDKLTRKPASGDKSFGDQISDDLLKIRPATDDAEESFDKLGTDFTDSFSAILSFTDVVSESFKAIFNNIGEEFLLTTAQIKEFNQIFVSVFTRGITNAVSTTVTALQRGEDAFKALGNAILGLIGDLAISIGQFILAVGIAKTLLPKDPGPATIAAGIGLIALGTLLKNISGSSFVGGSAGAAPGSSQFEGGDNIEQPEIDQEDLEESRRTNVSIVVEGNIFNTEETGRQLVETIQDSFDTEGTVLVTA